MAAVIQRPRVFHVHRFAQAIREGRKRCLLNQRQAGAPMGWCQSFVSGLDMGQVLPRHLADLLKYLEVIGVDPRTALAALAADLGPSLATVFEDFDVAIKAVQGLDIPSLGNIGPVEASASRASQMEGVA
jgi:hypothetical protein